MANAQPGQVGNQAPADTSEERSFEQALERLEQIVAMLESGELKLDESLRLFQEGIGLARYCSGKLDEAEATIETLVERADGALETEPFEDVPEEAS